MESYPRAMAKFRKSLEPGTQFRQSDFLTLFREFEQISWGDAVKILCANLLNGRIKVVKPSEDDALLTWGSWPGWEKWL